MSWPPLECLAMPADGSVVVMTREQHEAFLATTRTEARTEAAKERDEVLAGWRERVPHPSELDAFNVVMKRLRIAMEALQAIPAIPSGHGLPSPGAGHVIAQDALKRIAGIGSTLVVTSHE